MSTPLDRGTRPDDLSHYAPKWARDRPIAPVAQAPNPPSDGWRSEDPLPLGLQGLPPVVDLTTQLRDMPYAIVPTIAAEPERRGRYLAAAFIGGALTVAAAVIAAIVVGVLPPGIARMAAREPATREPAAEPGSFSTRYSDSTSGLTRSDPAPPQLVVAPAPAGRNDDAFPLGLTLNGPGNGAAVAITGLADGVTLTRGQPTGSGSWWLSASDLDGAAIRPPHSFAGTMEVLAELRMADGAVVERRPLRFERAAPPPVRPVVRQIDRDELADLVKRGEDFIATGDLASARLVLQRAAESGDARAALALAGTYDPNVIERLGIKGIAADVGLALTWYGKARDFGSAEAPRRLEQLASRDH